MPELPPVERWDTDFDVLSPAYVADPFSIWDELRDICPVASSQRRCRTWLPLRYRDLVEVAHDVEHFSSTDITVVPFAGAPGEEVVLQNGLPPLSADPPLHTWTRRMLLPWFSRQRVEGYEPFTRKLCGELVDGFVNAGATDAAPRLCPTDPGTGHRRHPRGPPVDVGLLHRVGGGRTRPH